MHCDSCASKIVKSVRAFQGVETVKAESETGKVTVTGVVDPAKLREQLEVKTKKKVELVSPQPNKEKEKDNKNKDSKDKNTSNEDKNKEKKKAKEAPVTTVVLKVDFHCEGCIEKIQKTASKTKGVSGLSLDHEKQLVTVKGTMDVKKLAESLTRKLKRDVEIKRGGGRGKDNAGDKGGEGMNTMEHVAAQPAHGSMYDPDEDGYSNQFYAVARDLLSDENPNCVVM
ncbi:Heavy metal transport/detoxification superfamily protein [Raphanus sativus]|nr:Heavy metal transport/detoxification superfamily protein [Raphanus sativus]